jgi:hypothetical protein
VPWFVVIQCSTEISVELRGCTVYLRITQVGSITSISLGDNVDIPALTDSSTSKLR